MHGSMCFLLRSFLALSAIGRHTESVSELQETLSRNPLHAVLLHMAPYLDEVQAHSATVCTCLGWALTSPPSNLPAVSGERLRELRALHALPE